MLPPTPSRLEVPHEHRNEGQTWEGLTRHRKKRGGDRGSDVLSTGQPTVEHNAAILNDFTKNELTQENP